MRFLLAYIAAFSLALAVAVVPFLVWDYRYRAAWLPDRPGSATMANLSLVLGLASIFAALALPLTYLSTTGQRKPWPMKSFIAGILSGVFFGVVVGGVAIYAVHHGWK